VGRLFAGLWGPVVVAGPGEWTLPYMEERDSKTITQRIRGGKREEVGGTAVCIRLASLDEAPVVHSVMLKAFSEYHGVLGVSSSALTESVEDVRAAMQQGGGILALMGGEPVGSARFTLHTDHLHLARLSTLPEVRGQGISRAMVTWLEEHARSLGLSEVQLNVRMSLMNNWRFYTALGYEAISIVPHSRGADTSVKMVKLLVPREDDLLQRLFRRFVTDLQEAEPAALAIMLFGSLVRGNAGPFSDIDLRVVRVHIAW
jgi:ribosomal protein S18 acetylase RimI-like enzyme